jgi:hypothetical protein
LGYEGNTTNNLKGDFFVGILQQCKNTRFLKFIKKNIPNILQKICIKNLIDL